MATVAAVISVLHNKIKYVCLQIFSAVVHDRCLIAHVTSYVYM